jgi:ribosomal-protein-alanine N-acetyltransferase
MRPPEIFETERLVLRPPRAADARAIFEGYAQDAEVVRYLVWRPHKDIGETEQFLERCEERSAAGEEFPWAITLKPTGELIGMAGLRPRGFKADVGYVLARRFWGRGYTLEALRPIVEWALKQPGIFRVWALCDVDNRASARVLEKVGMTREGRLRRYSLHPNVSDEPRDSYCYAVVK